MPAQLLGGPAQMQGSFSDFAGLTANGPIASRLLAVDRELRQRGLWTGIDAMCPFIGPDGASYINAYGEDGSGHAIRINANATLLPTQWTFYDDMIIRTAQPRLRVWGKMRQKVPRVLTGGLGITSLQYNRVGNITPATISMSPRRRSESDRLEIEPANLPIPIIHKDFPIDGRQLMSSQMPSLGGELFRLDTQTVIAATNECTKLLEQLAAGTISFTHAGATVYGLGNHPDRNIVNLSDPTDPAWTPELLVQDFLEMMKALEDDGYMGPYDFFLGRDWSMILGEDYSAVKGDKSVRTRLMDDERIASMQVADYISGYRILGAQMTPDVCEAVVVEDFRSIQWDTDGSGFGLEYKVYGAQVPFVKSDIDGNSGVVDGVVV
jgi:hypothetical protein